MSHDVLTRTFESVDEQIRDLERIMLARGSLPLVQTVEHAINLLRTLIIAYVADAGGKDLPGEDEDILEVFKKLVKGDPSWNTIRDNLRELVYYRNCAAMDRPDALPKAPERMAVRTLRHVFLFMKSRCIREGRLGD